MTQGGICHGHRAGIQVLSQLVDQGHKQYTTLYSGSPSNGIHSH